MISPEDNLASLEPPQPSDSAPQSLETGTPAEFASSARAAQELSGPARLPISEDLRTPWDWIDLVIFALLALSGSLFVTICVLIAFALVLHLGSAQLRDSGAARTYFAVTNQVVLSLALLAYIAVQIRTRAQVPFWRTLGWRRLETGRMKRSISYLGLIASGILLSVLVEFVSGIFQPKGELPIETIFQDRRSALVLMLMSVLLAPLFEETIFRGYIYPAIARRLGIATSVVITGTLFGLLHAPQLWGGWVQIGLLILVGIIFTYARATTGTVVASYLLHLSYNSSLFLGFLINSRWLRAVSVRH
jgi:membrane protease YdiL (CAAX protease family)